MVCLDFRTRTARFVVTSARIIRISIIVGALETKPDCFLCEDVVDSVVDARVPTVKVQGVAVHILVNTVVHRKEEIEGDELAGKRVEAGPRIAVRRASVADRIR